MDMYEAVTVVAVASEYGNGSTGGVISLETKDPDNIIQDGRDGQSHSLHKLIHDLSGEYASFSVTHDRPKLISHRHN